jgi:hypothetical protein
MNGTDIGCLYNLCQQLGYIPVHLRPSHDADTGHFLGIGWHRVCCQDPAAPFDFNRNIELVVPGHGLVHLSTLARSQSVALFPSVIKVACAIAELEKVSVDAIITSSSILPGRVNVKLRCITSSMKALPLALPLSSSHLISSRLLCAPVLQDRYPSG